LQVDDGGWLGDLLHFITVTSSSSSSRTSCFSFFPFNKSLFEGRSDDVGTQQQQQPQDTRIH
jgi:hypothetical protein